MIFNLLKVKNVIHVEVPEFIFIILNIQANHMIKIFAGTVLTAGINGQSGISWHGFNLENILFTSHGNGSMLGQIKIGVL